MRWTFTVLLAIAALFATGPGASVKGQTDLALDKRIGALVNAEISAHRIPGYAVAVIKDGQVLLKQGFGKADVERNLDVTPETVFGIASLTKAFTAISILLLQERGKIGLEDPVGKYVQNLPPSYQGITIRQLATMTGGISGEDEPSASWPQQIRMLARTPLASPPGTRYLYSNISYRLLGSVVENVEQKPFLSVLGEAVLAPNGMGHTGTTSSLASSGLVAEAYTASGRTEYRSPDVSFTSGMLASSLDDMTKYALALLNRKMLSAQSYDLMWLQRPTLPDGKVVKWSFGWSSRIEPSFGNTRVVEWYGTNVGVGSRLILLPERNSAIVTLCNLQTPVANQIATQIAEILFGNK